MESDNPINCSPHPTALAFSRALESHLASSSSNKTRTKLNTNNDTKKQTKKHSQIMQKSLLLGWRNRNSLSASYPLTINIPIMSAKKFHTYNSVQEEENHKLVNKSDHDVFPSSSIAFSFTMAQVHDKVSQQNNLDYGTGAFIWPASMVLLKFLEHQCLSYTHDDDDDDNHNDKKVNFSLHKKSVLDLGSGTGITSVAAALLGASMVICTDGSEPVVQLAKCNVERVEKEFDDFRKQSKRNQNIEDPFKRIHQSLHQMHVCEFWWGNQEHTHSIRQKFASNSSNKTSYPDIILVSDCVLPKLYPIAPLVQALKECMGPMTRAYLSYEYRFFEQYEAKDKFWELAKDSNLEVKEIPREEQHEVYQAEDMEIWEVRVRHI